LRENGHLKFRFRDNGAGFKMNGSNVGHGLNNVKRRAGLIDASITIKSEGTGTVAELDLPITNLN
jgi:signal transduction histidine kinase